MNVFNMKQTGIIVSRVCLDVHICVLLSMSVLNIVAFFTSVEHFTIGETGASC